MSIEADVLIIGAGPVGLFQAYYLGLQGIKNVHIVDSLPDAGGQCRELYPTKPIYDIPAIPEVTGAQLTLNLLHQLKPFPPTFYFNEQVVTVEPVDFPCQSDGPADIHPPHRVVTDKGTTFIAKAVVIAAGMGSFEPNKLVIPGAENFPKLAYSVRDPELYRDKEVIILGGGDSALDWTVELATKYDAFITLIHRTPEYRAHKATIEKVKALEAAEDQRVQCLTGQVVGLEFHPDTGHDNQGTVQIDVKGFDGVTRQIYQQELLCFYGLSPKLGPVGQWGLGMTGNRLTSETKSFETTMPGVFAVGDVAFYPGKQKLILSGFHEAALATYKIAEYVNGKKLVFAYTTTSTIMHDRLGVKPDLS